MKHLTILLLSLPLVSAYAQNKPDEIVTARLECYNTMKVFNELQKTYQETPMVLGKTSDEAKYTMSLWINATTKSWTIVATKDTLSCIIGAGTDIELSPIFLKKKDSI
jgi:hypothetical protein